MVYRCRWVGLLLTLGAFTWTAAAAVVAPEIKDEGKFFSAEAVKKANQQIREIYRKYQRDVLVETYPTPPADQIDKVKEMDTKERSAFFGKWAKERAEHCVVRGVYLLICKEPKFLYIEVTPQAKLGPAGEVRQKLFDVMAADFRKDRFDDGLAAALKLLEERLAKAK